jgi:hypothetical protein
MSQIQKGETFVDGQVVTFDMLNDLVDSAQLLPNCINGQVEKLQGTIMGTEAVLIYDPISGALRKAQVQNLLSTGLAIETNYIEGAQYGGQTGQLSIVSSEGFYITNNDTSNANAGLNISSVGGNLNLTSTASGYNHGNGKITLSSGLGGVEFVTSGIGKFVFNSSSSLKLPVGTTAQRPATPVAGDLRFNSTTSDGESYNGTAWQSFNPVSAVLLNENGYIKLNNGLTIQWGTFTANGSNNIPNPQIVTFPTPFTTAIVYAGTSVDGANTHSQEVASVDWTTAGKTTTSQLGIYVNYVGVCKFWAIGY